ncbi:penicillin acylase family protein [Leptobacterium flavescens]|uniref:Penicillin acylase family protein n=1 Tax=Leptobacterium flavescens TaxID=472055 RepID=A0A6P0UNB7_9FLAO|nr:penicillin acylase family protein [Leptobacterium flavescens]NER14665.1 penicillin acylase family protein [Leptobacterium flavescens]
MRILKKTLKIIVVILVLASIAGWLFYRSLLPQYDGNLELSGLDNEVEVHYDSYGIPHIFAEGQEDAYRTLGYVHAQDRLWQMEVMRRIAPGRLSEIFGSALIDTDKLFMGLGIEEASQKAIDALDKESDAYKFALAYLDGINQFLESGPTPIEFHLVGIKKEKFELIDMYNVFGYMAFSFAMAHRTDPLLSSLKEKLGASYLEDLQIDIDPKSTLIHTTNKDSVYEQIAGNVSAIVEGAPFPTFEGSNSWVVAPEKTKNGKVLFANDPHIGYSQPSVWYEAHIKTPDYEMYGYHLAGIPFPLLGHNRNYAYGLTMFENDDVDFYREQNNPSNANQYQTPDGWKSYTQRTKTLKVKGEDPIELKIKSSRHGPVMNDFIEGISQEEPIALYWVYTQLPIKVLESIYTISHAESMEDVERGAAMVHAPGLNVMYGDAQDNIAWWASAKLYKFRDSLNPKFILDGASGKDDPVRYLDFSENPQAKNPSWNYVYSANNQPDSIAGILYPGYYLPEDRAKHIVQLLEPENEWTKEGFSGMINQNRSIVATEVVKEFISAVPADGFSAEEQKAYDILREWDGSNTIDATAPVIYNKWIYLYLRKTYRDEMGEEIFDQLLNTHLMKRLIATQIANENSIWWDNTDTDMKESRADILKAAFTEAIVALQAQLGTDMEKWKWGKVHTLEHGHALGNVKSLKPYFNVGTFEMNGAREVLDNESFSYDETGEYPIKSGPSTRRIIDFSDVENSISIIPTGQSGNPFSKHYKDQAEMFSKGEFRKMLLNEQEIRNTAKSVLTFSKK